MSDAARHAEQMRLARELQASMTRADSPRGRGRGRGRASAGGTNYGPLGNFCYFPSYRI